MTHSDPIYNRKGIENKKMKEKKKEGGWMLRLETANSLDGDHSFGMSVFSVETAVHVQAYGGTRCIRILKTAYLTLHDKNEDGEYRRSEFLSTRLVLCSLEKRRKI